MQQLIKGHRLLLFLLLSAFIFFGWLGERIPAHNETGWDGSHYADFAVNLPQLIHDKAISSYQFWRILPSFLVYAILQLLHLPATPYNIVHCFLALNTVLVFGGALYYFQLANYFKVDRNAEIIGFAALFLNFCILKQTWYYPVLTDIFAFVFGLLFAGECLRRRWVTAAITFLLGSFTYPQFLLTSFPLFITAQSGAFNKIIQRALPIAKWVVPSLGAIAVTVYFLFGKQIIHPKYQLPVQPYWLWLSAPLLLFYLYRVFDFPLPAMPAATSKGGVRIILCFLLFAGSYLLLNHVIKYFSVPEEDFTTSTFLWVVLQSAVMFPLSNLVFHFTYYGPAVILILLYYKKWIVEAASQGWQFLAFIIFYLLLGISSESRCYINAWPLCVVFLIIILDGIRFSNTFMIVYLLLCLAQSHFWLQINVPGIYEECKFARFPEQWYFMHQGPFSETPGYLINAASFAATAGLLLYFKKKIADQD